MFNRLLLLQRQGKRVLSRPTSGSLSSKRSARMASTLPKLPIFEAIACHDPQSTAIIHSESRKCFSYGQLLHDVSKHKEHLNQQNVGKPIVGQRISFLIENSYDYVVTLLSILSSDAIAVPLSAGFPANELRYILNNSQSTRLLSSPKFGSKADEVVHDGLEVPCSVQVLEPYEPTKHQVNAVEIKGESEEAGGMMLYTSGTTSRPKGVLLHHSVLTAQCESLLKAWKYSSKDHLLHVLPLHHIHGTVNALLAPLFAGSTVEFAFPFNADAVWKRIAGPFMEDEKSQNDVSKPVTFFTVVPTIYNRLLSTHKDLPQPVKEAAQEALKPANLRLNISGSAALPTPLKAAWTELSQGNALLERYGMTEVGMALSCGLEFTDRVDGSVGWPLPNVEVRLVDTDSEEVIQIGDDKTSEGKQREGEIQLRGPTVFREYWRNPEATAKEFVESTDGKGKWFKTGDVAIRRTIGGTGNSDQNWARGPMYFIQGRRSTDIIKSGGEKISALEIERELLSLPQVLEAAVVGVTSEQWGQKVAAVVVLDLKQSQSPKSGKKWGIMDMRRALKDKLANYKIPQEMKVVDELPKNAMGKVNKKSLVKEIFLDSP